MSRLDRDPIEELNQNHTVLTQRCVIKKNKTKQKRSKIGRGTFFGPPLFSDVNTSSHENKQNDGGG